MDEKNHSFLKGINMWIKKILIYSLNNSLWKPLCGTSNGIQFEYKVIKTQQLVRNCRLFETSKGNKQSQGN